MKLLTEIPLRLSRVTLTRGNRVMTIGSCFSDNMAAHLRDAGFCMMSNPFGTLYNPESIASAIERLDSGRPFTESDCAEIARKTPGEFLDHANSSLERSRIFWKDCDRVIVTYGTARVWRRNGRTVSNCLKRPSAEFTHELLTLERIAELSGRLVLDHPDKQFIFTVSPIRHLSQGAEANTLSKALLHLGISKAVELPSADYFPAWELMMDELRDYRFYAADLVHPSEVAVGYLWEKFLAFCVPASGLDAVRAAERAARRSRHRPLNPGDQAPQ